MNVCQCILLNSEFNNSRTRVESPITEHVPIMEDFHSLTKFSDFCVIGCANWRTKCSFRVRSKGVSQRVQEEDE